MIFPLKKERLMIFGHLFDDNRCFSLFLLVKNNRERSKKKKRIRVTCEYERKSCPKIVVQISFLFFEMML